jgi:hypothetical protein
MAFEIAGIDCNNVTPCRKRRAAKLANGMARLLFVLVDG